MRRTCLRLGLGATLLLPFALPAQSTIKITSPADGVVVRPGQTIDVQVSISGPFSIVTIADPSPTMNIALHTLKSPPYRLDVTVPPNGSPGLYMITAELHAPPRVYPVVSDTVRVDVELPESPQELRVSAAESDVQVGGGTDLKVLGILDGGNEIVLNRSSRTTYQAYPPGIVSVSKEGQVTANAPGTATVLVQHQDLQARVNVSVANASLKITSPADGTVVHPGETLVVDVSASGGPFEFVTVFSLAVEGGNMLTTEPYRFSLKVSMPRKPGPTGLAAIGRMGSLAIFSPPISVDVERSETPEAIFIDRSVIGTERLRVGRQGRIYVYGKFRDDPQVNLTESSLTTHEADKTGIVSITKEGDTMGLSPGSTNVNVRYGDLRTTVRIVVE